MKKFLLSIGIAAGTLALVPVAFAQDYTYDCTCLYASPNGSCMEYTCDTYRRRSYYNDSYYNYNDSCDSRYDYGCNDSDYRNYDNNNYNYYRPYNNNSYYNGNSSSWTIRRNTSYRSPYRRYLDPYYDDQMYYY